ncbi:MAG TPA: head maturation protease, ClpP-related [Vineibacter sp.]|nr:head maturation protease, ClpP-related [Vineibacter sp.]
MTKKTLPGAPEGRPCAGVTSQIQPRAFDRWHSGVRAADKKDDERSIGVYDVIGQDFWSGEGVTAKRVAAALRSMGKGDVTVNINSPGGDMFEGLAIYNLLREHDGEVTVKVLGLAASAASIIAMAGDKVQVARAGFLMVHNAWVLAVGNRNDLLEIADTLKPFDDAMASIYAARTGQEPKAMAKLMDAETWIGGEAAVEGGFADELLPSDQVEKGAGKASASAVRRIEAGLRASGMPKSEAMRLISELKSSAGDPPGSGEGDPTGRVGLAPDSFSVTAALAASLVPTDALKEGPSCQSSRTSRPSTPA